MSEPITNILYISDGTQTEYDVPFVYLKRDFVKVYINGYATTYFTWVSPTRIKLRRSPDGTGAKILIQRETQLTPMVVFKDATNLTASDLNLLTNQALHLIQEGHNAISVLELTGLANNEEFVLPPLDPLSVLGILQGRISALELESGLNDRINLIDVSDTGLINRMSVAEENIESLTTQIGSLVYSPYSAEETYDINDVVSYRGKLYKSLQADNLNNIPDAEGSTYWLKISDVADLGAAINNEAAIRLSDVGALAYQDSIIQSRFDVIGEAALNAIDGINKVDSKAKAYYKQSIDALSTETEARVQALETLQSTFDTEINSTNATIANLQTTIATADNALAQSISQLSSTVNDNTTSIETLAETTDGINAKYTVKIDANGYVVGYGLIAHAAMDNQPPDSAFIIKADKFAFGYPGYQGAYPFMIGVVDGVSRVGVNGELLVDGTIGANKIKTNELVVGSNISMGPNAYISWGNVTSKPNTTYIDANGIYTGTLTANQVDVWNSIQSAYPAYVANSQGWKIDKYGQCEFQNIKARGDIEATSLKANTAMIDTAHIKDLSVDTLKIADEAVTLPLAFYGGNGVTTGSVTSNTFKKVVISLSGYTYCNSYNGVYQLTITRNGTPIFSTSIQGFGQIPLYTGCSLIDYVEGLPYVVYVASLSNGSVSGNFTFTILGIKK